MKTHIEDGKRYILPNYLRFSGKLREYRIVGEMPPVKGEWYWLPFNRAVRATRDMTLPFLVVVPE